MGLKISMGKFLSQQISFQKRILPINLFFFHFYSISKEGEKGTNFCLSSFFSPVTASSSLFPLVLWIRKTESYVM